MRTVTVAAMMIALLPATAYSQGDAPPPKTTRTDQQKKEDAEIEKAYQQMMKRSKGQAAPTPAKTDPWQTIRPAAGGDSGKK
jgi:hypothetical protein